jgi:hypothetical protein
MFHEGLRRQLDAPAKSAFFTIASSDSASQHIGRVTASRFRSSDVNSSTQYRSEGSEQCRFLHWRSPLPRASPLFESYWDFIQFAGLDNFSVRAKLSVQVPLGAPYRRRIHDPYQPRANSDLYRIKSAPITKGPNVSITHKFFRQGNVAAGHTNRQPIKQIEVNHYKRIKIGWYLVHTAIKFYFGDCGDLPPTSRRNIETTGKCRIARNLAPTAYGRRRPDGVTSNAAASLTAAVDTFR